MQRIGVDVGGTFTDIVVSGDEGEPTIRKVLSTPDDYSAAIRSGLDELIQEGVVEPPRVTKFVHAATVATNSVITGTGARVGLITTFGFRDVLEIGRLRMPRLYDMSWEKPAPLVRRALRREVIERVDFRGEVVQPLDHASLEAAVAELVSRGVDSIAVCLLHSYANPAHEQAVGDYIATHHPELSVSLSHHVLPEMKEYERTSTTVIEAFVQPLVREYLTRLACQLRELGIAAPLMMMHSAGGMMTAASAARHAARIIESGPAAGVVGAAALGKELGLQDIISFDMGGTTAKACLIEDGEPQLASEFEVGGGVNVGHRLLRGGGHVLRLPSVDLVEIGAGGGSIAWIDRGQTLRVGVQSAGADPGPACYGLGGVDPTVTDANVVLGYLNPHQLAGGDLRIDATLAANAIAKKIADPLGLSLEEAAYGIHAIVNSSMVRAVQAVSSEIGRDPNDYLLFAYGGGGPVHAAGLSVEARIPEIVIPQGPGVFSAAGLLFAPVEHRYTHSLVDDLRHVDLARLQRLFEAMDGEALDEMATEGIGAPDVALEHYVDVRYARQNSELSIPVPDVTEAARQDLIEAFHREHMRTYGYRADTATVQVVTLRVRARAQHADELDSTLLQARRPSKNESTTRACYFGTRLGWIKTPVVDRASVGDSKRPGPLIIEEYDSTTVVPPGAEVSLDEMANIRLSVTSLL